MAEIKFGRKRGIKRERRDLILVGGKTEFDDKLAEEGREAKEDVVGKERRPKSHHKQETTHNYCCTHYTSLMPWRWCG
jgi:hypothetical protein